MRRYSVIRITLLAVLGALFTGPAVSRAEPASIPSLFSDHMVLQQGQPIPVWGKGDPGAKVSVKLGSQTADGVVGRDGWFRVSLPAQQASAEPVEMSITVGEGASKTERKIKDVVVGEVWLCSGQSNMAMRLSNALDAEKEAAGSNDPLLRTFNVTQRPAERPADLPAADDKWMTLSPTTAPDFSAVSLYFAKKLRKELNVPVGIVLPAWGGSSVATWMSPQAMATDPLRTLVPEDLVGWRYNVQPYRLHNGMLKALAPYPVAGALWYQGETEGTEFQGTYRNAYLYRYLFPAMVADWRRLWQRDDLPFYWIQLPNLRTPKLHWPEVRESQAVAQSIPNSGMIPSIDIGDDNNLHPKNKRLFGERAADVVLTKQYGKSLWAGAPQFESAAIEGKSIRVKLKDAGKGLKTTDGKAPNAFQVAGKDGKYVDADAKIDGVTVVVSASSVAAPATVRYAWSQAPGVNLTSDAGLPVVPFRTDTLPIIGSQAVWRDLPKKADLAITTNGGTLAKTPKGDVWVAGSSEKALDKLLTDKQMLSISPNASTIRFLDKPTRNQTDSPSLYWTTTPAATKSFDARKGVSAEVLIQSSANGDPLRGFDLKVGVKQPGGSLMKYSISILPNRIHAFGRNEFQVIRGDIDNVRERVQYRLAIRPDGVGQLYVNGEKLCLIEGMSIDDAKADSYVKVGKTTEAGEYIVTLIHASFDPAGAFAP